MFSVSSDDILGPEEIEKYWKLVDAADRAEIKSFVDNSVFRLDLRVNAKNVVDAIWVRRWKDRKTLQLKSRLCGRGYLDRQKAAIDRHSSTASRLSHRLLCSQAIQHRLQFRSYDLTTAFLQGLRFTELAKAARGLGHQVRTLRQVWLAPPANVWRHLRTLTTNLCVQDIDICLFRIELLKAMYGLVDRPLMFQLALLSFLVNETDARKSILDDNYLY